VIILHRLNSDILGKNPENTDILKIPSKNYDHILNECQNSNSSCPFLGEIKLSIGTYVLSELCEKIFFSIFCQFS
jgi:hypothetical protein